MADAPKTFSDYYAATDMRGAAAAPPVSAPKTGKSFKPIQMKVPESAKSPQDPLSWLMDIISRPLYGMTNTTNAHFQNTKRAPILQEKFASGDVLGGIAEASGQMFHAATAGVRGVFSTSDDDKAYTSDLIEKGTDTLGEYFDRENYVDEVDNVNPVLKGIAGFAGDIGFDPLTYVPGALILSAGKTLVKGGKAVTAGGRAVVEAAKTARDVKAGEAVAETVAKDAAKLSTSTELVHVPRAKSAEELQSAADATFTATYNRDLNKLSNTEFDATVNPRQAGVLKTNFAREVATPKGATLRSALDGIKPGTLTAATQATARVASDPVTFKGWVKGAVDEFRASASNIPLAAWKKVSVGGEDIPLPVALQRIIAGDKIAIEDVKFWHKNSFLRALNATGKRGLTLSPLGASAPRTSSVVVDAAREADLTTEAAETLADFHMLRDDPQYLAAQLADSRINQANSVDVVAGANRERAVTAKSMLAESELTARIAQDALDAYRAGAAAEPVVRVTQSAMSRFNEEAANNRAALDGIFGREIVIALNRLKNSDNFDTTVAELKAIVDQSVDFTQLKTVSTPVQTLLREFGIDPAAIPNVVTKWSDAPNKTPPAKTVMERAEELARTMGEPMPTPLAIEAAEQGLRRMAHMDIVTPRKPDGPYIGTTDGGVLRTSDVAGEGWGRILRQANTYFQYNVFSGVSNHLSTAAEKWGLRGSARVSFMRTELKQALRSAERYLDSNGVPLKIGVGFDTVALGNSQIVDVLDSLDPEGMSRYLFNWGTAVPITNLADAVFAALKTGDRSEVKAMLSQIVTKHTRADGSLKDLPNNLVKGGRLNSKIWGGDELVEGLTDLVMRATPTLQKVVEVNTRALAKRGITEGIEMTDNQLNHLEEVFSTRQGYGDILEELADTSSRVQKLSAATGTTQMGTNIAGTMAKAAIPKADMAAAEAAVKISSKMKATATASKGKTGTAVLDDAQRSVVNDAQRAHDATVVETFVADLDKTMDFGQRILQMMGTSFLARFVPVFSREAGNVAIHRDLVRSENWIRDVLAGTSNKLNNISARHPQERLVLAMQAVQSGSKGADPAVVAAADELRDIAHQIFGGGSRNSLMDNRFFANGASIHHVNAAITKYFKGSEKYLFNADDALQASKANGTNIMDEIAVQWKNWPIDDPAAFLNTMYTILAKVNADQSIAQGFINLVSKTPKAGQQALSSKVPRAGYSRISNEGGESVLARYMPNDVWYEDGILRQLGVVDTIMRSSLKLDGQLGKLVKDVYKPALDMWKYGMTLPNPTHHIRNGISDASLTYLVLGTKNSKDMYKKALKVMGQRNSYSEWDAIAALQGAKIKPAANGEIALQGKLGELTYDQVYAEFASRGNLPKFRTLENFEDEASDTGALNKIWNKVTKSRPAQVVGGVSEARDHYFRLAHGIQFIEQNISSGKFASMEDMMVAASDQVRKWHPDGSDLTVAEQGFRLVIPFYSWQRKAIPLIIESLLTQPARVASFPKASFNLSVAMGVNPDSLAEPFPEDQMFPSYMTNKLQGPQFQIDGKYYAINPGFASNDVLNEYLGDEAFRSVLGSVSPIIRAPFELAAGGQVGTGARINDVSDYIDGQIPGVGHLSRFTGNSFTGSLVSMMQGQGVDPQYQIAQGNKDPIAGPGLAVTNWLTGLGIQGMSQKNQINYAEIEKRNREGKDAGF